MPTIAGPSALRRAATQSLHSFKATFGPRYEPMFLGYRDEGDLPRIGIALTRAYLPGTAGGDLAGLVLGRSA